MHVKHLSPVLLATLAVFPPALGRSPAAMLMAPTLGLTTPGPDGESERSRTADLASPALNFQTQPDATPAPTSPPTEADEDHGKGDSKLAEKLSNPIADLISIPFQFNFDRGYGPNDANRYLLNIQPVIPVSITEDWNLIIRTIVPIVDQESPASGIDSHSGMGDILQSFFCSPKAPADGWIWGVGPVFNWPTATENALGSRKWSVGPTAVLLRQEHGFTYGILVNHLWSFAGESDRGETNQTFLQPFLAYTFPTATTLQINTESTYDWGAHQWTVPINAAVAQIVRLGKLPIQLQFGGRYYAEKPDGGPEWGLRFTFTILLPK